MDPLKSAPARFLVLCLGALAASGAARADLITPNSIPQPPPAVGSTEGTPIPPSTALVTTQYAQYGLFFSPVPDQTLSQGINTAFRVASIANFSGSAAWVPAISITDGFHLQRELEYTSYLTVQFVRPGGATPTTVNSVTANVLHLPGTLPIQLIAFDGHNNVLGDTDVASGTGPDCGELLTLSAPGISSFAVTYDGSITGGAQSYNSPWGVAGIEFTPATAPEPGALALAGVGALALAGWAWGRRRAVPAT